MRDNTSRATTSRGFYSNLLAIAVDNMGVFRFQQLLAFSSKMAAVAATSTDKRSVTLLTTYNTRSVHAVTHRAQQNLRDFTHRGCVRVILKIQKKSLFARSGLKKMAENHHFSVRV